MKTTKPESIPTSSHGAVPISHVPGGDPARLIRHGDPIRDRTVRGAWPAWLPVWRPREPPEAREAWGNEAARQHALDASDALKTALRKSDPTTKAGQNAILAALQRLTEPPGSLQNLAQSEVQDALRPLLAVAYEFPDDEGGAVLAAATLAAVVHTMDWRTGGKEVAKKIGPDLLRELGALADAFDRAGRLEYLEALRHADQRLGTRRGERFAEDSTLRGRPSATAREILDLALRQHRVVNGDQASRWPAVPPAGPLHPAAPWHPTPAWHHAPPDPTARPTLEPAAVVDRLKGGRLMEVLLKVLQMAAALEEHALNMLSTSDDYSQADMLVFKSTMDRVRELQSYVTEIAKGNQDVRDTFVRNV